MEEPGIEVSEDAHGERTEGVCDLGVGGEADGGEVVHDVADEADEEHDGDLFPFALVDDDEAESEGGNKNEREPAGGGVLARDLGGGVGIDAAVERGSDCDAEA